MTNFSGVARSGFWRWLTPERAVLVVPVLAGLALSVALVSVGVTPLSLRVKEQQELVDASLSQILERYPQMLQKFDSPFAKLFLVYSGCVIQSLRHKKRNFNLSISKPTYVSTSTVSNTKTVSGNYIYRRCWACYHLARKKYNTKIIPLKTLLRNALDNQIWNMCWVG